MRDARKKSNGGPKGPSIRQTGRRKIVNMGVVIWRAVLLVLLGTLSAASWAGAAADDIRVVGRLVPMERAPACGMLLPGSPATYEVILGPDEWIGSRIQVLIACIEMPLAEGNARAFHVGDMHDLVVTLRNIHEIELPDPPAGNAFYLKAASILAVPHDDSLAPGNSRQ